MNFILSNGNEFFQLQLPLLNEKHTQTHNHTYV